MRLSKLFTKTTKDFPKDEVSLNAKLLIKAGFINKELAGVYTFMPLGLRVLRKIIKIIQEEMDAIGGQEIFLSVLQNPKVWMTTGRWSDEVVDIWFKTKLKNNTELGLAPTHEEPLTNLMKDFIKSYKDLPVYVYQFQTKFRNEIRAKSGLMRTREFLMKDLYSFNRTEAELEEFYHQTEKAYRNIFDRAGIGERTYFTFASGGSFSKYSHEFQTVSESGEDVIYIDDEKKIAVNKEVFTDEVLNDLKIDKEKLREEQAIEVGNIFKLGTKFSDALGLMYKDENGKEHPVVMGSYGIGPARLMGTIVELNNDENGIIWPENVAPFLIHLIKITGRGVDSAAEKLYGDLNAAGLEVLFDDREDASAGERFAEADLIGCPIRIVVSEKTLGQGSVEVKERKSKEVKTVKIGDVVGEMKGSKS